MEERIYNERWNHITIPVNGKNIISIRELDNDSPIAGIWGTDKEDYENAEIISNSPKMYNLLTRVNKFFTDVGIESILADELNEFIEELTIKLKKNEKII